MPSRTNWIPVHCNLPDHPKTVRTAVALGIEIPQLLGHLLCLWTWVMTYENDGSIPLQPAEVELNARWTHKGRGHQRRGGAFYTALVENGWIDPGPPAKLHNWESYGGQIVHSRERHREAVSRSRDGHVTVTSRSRDGHVSATQQNIHTEHTGDGFATRSPEGNGTPKKNPGTIRTDADLSHWQEPPEKISPEELARIHAAIGKPAVKPMDTHDLEQRREKLKAQARKTADST